jgi:hypothetical protein
LQLIKIVSAVTPTMELVRPISPAPAAKAGLAIKKSKTVVINFFTILL